MIKPIIKKLSRTIVPLLLSTSCSWVLGKELVLVASQNTDLQSVPIKDLRRAYLGFPPQRESTHIKPFRNVSDAEIERYFYSHIMFMTEESYKRLVLERSFRQGIIRPPEISEEASLATIVKTTESNVSYMWRKNVGQYPGIKIIQVLWQEDD